MLIPLSFIFLFAALAEDPFANEQGLFAGDAASGDQLGYSAAIDGDTVVMGAPFVDHAGLVDQGAAYVFVRTGGGWVEQQKLVATDPAQGDYFGYSVAISGDTVIVGSPQADHSGLDNAGAAYIFIRSGTTWAAQQKLVSPTAGADDEFGRSVAISADT